MNFELAQQIMQDLLKFIKCGKINDDFEIGMSISEIKEKLGEPSGMSGNTDAGYIFYDSIRIGHFKHMVDEVAILFDEGYSPINLNIPLLSGETIQISSNTKINEFIQVLNYSEIGWHSDREKDFDYFFIRAESGVSIIFDLTTGCLARISLSRSL